MSQDGAPMHAKKDSSKKTKNILLVVIIVLAVILLAVLIPLTFCSNQEPGDGTEESADKSDGTEEMDVVNHEGIVDRITDEALELDVDGTVIPIYLDGYELPEGLASGDKVYVEYMADKVSEQNILIYLKILEKANQLPEQETQAPEQNIVSHVGIVERIMDDSIYLIVNDGILQIYLDGYELPEGLASGDKVYVEYLVDKNAEANTLKYLEILEKAEVSEAPAITIKIYEGPVYVKDENICYYRIKAEVSGSPVPEIIWSRDDSNGSLGADKAQVNLTDVDEEYELEATANNSVGTAKDNINLEWGCEKPPANSPPEIEEIVIMDDFYTDTEYPVYVIASDPDGDTLSYKWSVTAGSVEKSTSNPMYWTTPDEAGNYEIKVTVDDGNNGAATVKKTVEVKAEEPPEEPPEEEITDIIWQWQEFESGDGSITNVDDPARYMLLLKSDGNMYVLADCNNGSGTYIMQDSSLTLKLSAMTRMACEDGSLSDKYISYLGNVVSYVIKDGILYLNLKADAGNMVFSNGGNI